MTSSNSVLRAPRIESVATTLGTRTVDPATRAAIAEARNSGYAEGHAAGKREAALEAHNALERATAILDAAVASGRQQIVEAVGSQSNAIVDLAIEIAKQVVESVPPDAGKGLAEKLEVALQQIDDPELVVRVSPNDVTTLSPLFEHRKDVTLIKDPSIHPGDAILSGRWAQADLQLAAAWKLIAEALHA